MVVHKPFADLGPVLKSTHHILVTEGRVYQKTQVYLDMALKLSELSTCLRSGYGAVLIKDDRIISAGFNGASRGMPHCSEAGCGREGIPSRTRYELCRSAHAEFNSLLFCREDPTNATLYIAGHNVQTKEEKRGASCLPCKMCYRAMRQAKILSVVIRDTNCLPLIYSLDELKFIEEE